MGIKNIMLDLLYPDIGCVLCGEEQRGEDRLCSKCRRGFEYVEKPKCKRCGKNLPAGASCDCEKLYPLFTEAASAVYYDGIARTAIRRLKYENCRWLAFTLAYYMYEEFKEHDWRPDLIIPAPIHKERLKERGYNHTELIAAEFSRLSGIPVNPHALIKTRNTPFQARLSRDERLSNVAGAYAVADPRSVCAKSILFLDDVYTTGSTSAECSKMLMLAGAGNVYVLTAASGRQDDTLMY